jgi:hypothetical protein
MEKKKIKEDNSQAIISFIHRRALYRRCEMCAVLFTATIKLYNWLEIPQEY